MLRRYSIGPHNSRSVPESHIQTGDKNHYHQRTNTNDTLRQHSFLEQHWTVASGRPPLENIGGADAIPLVSKTAMRSLLLKYYPSNVSTAHVRPLTQVRSRSPDDGPGIASSPMSTRNFSVSAYEEPAAHEHKRFSPPRSVLNKEPSSHPVPLVYINASIVTRPPSVS